MSLSQPPEDFFKCPVCFEILNGEVYQCKDGHVLCGNCHSKMKQCLQCRIDLEKIRCRFAESLMKWMLLPCPFKEVRCKESVAKKYMPNHQVHCKYRYRLRSICRGIGYNCDFKANLLKPSLYLNHFYTEHGILIREGTSVQVEIDVENLKNFKSVDIFWTPFILKLGKYRNSPKFLIVVRFDARGKSFWMGCNLLEDPLKQVDTLYTLQFSVLSNSEEGSNLDWSVYPKSFEFSGRVGRLLKWPIFKIREAVLNPQYVSEGCISMNITVKMEPESRGIACNPMTSMSLKLLPVQRESGERPLFKWKCGFCGLADVNNCWYKCLQCPNILCMYCRHQGKHSHHILAIADNKARQNYLAMVGINNRYSWEAMLPENNGLNTTGLKAEANDVKIFPSKCHNCDCYPILNACYTCLLCPTKVDFCLQCVQKLAHNHHIRGIVFTPEQGRFLTSLRKKGLPLIPLLASEVSLDD